MQTFVQITEDYSALDVDSYLKFFTALYSWQQPGTVCSRNIHGDVVEYPCLNILHLVNPTVHTENLVFTHVYGFKSI